MVIFLYLKKYIILVLPLCLAVCGKKNAQPAAENGGGTRIVTDKFGRELKIPQTVKTIICLGSGPPRMAAYMGGYGYAGWQ
jgi:ABC-type Fe3+-hydroxamate transport system substrate-binding protein